jgi:glycosyltransferase involved in cell wall biosynthesis
MKVLLCHNYYQQPGGEDLSFAAEAALLRSAGHDVTTFTVHNDTINDMGRLAVACKTLWNGETAAAVRAVIRRERPDVMHCTNTFPLLSPSIYHAARAEGVPVVQSLRNYRLMCPNALFLRGGRVCEDCMGKGCAWPSVRHRCYRGSRTASAVVALMLLLHRLLGTWRRAVDLYFTPTEFARRKYIQGGLPAGRIAVKPNFLESDPGAGTGAGRFALFVGRLSEEKGIDVMLDAWRHLDAPIPLKVIGDGPLAPRVQEAARRDARIEWLGRRSPAEVLAWMGDAATVIVPSTWYETFGRTVIEAYARGTPVVASRIGALAELVRDGPTGRLVEPGRPEALAAGVQSLLRAPDPDEIRRECRKEFLSRYTGEINLRMLLALYDRARGLDRRRGAP